MIEQTQTAASHTPGPWRVCREHPDPETNARVCEIFPAQRTSCISLAVIYVAPEGSEAHANARLIAAAPELFAAILQLETAASLVALADNSDKNPEANRLRDALALARAAIVKTTTKGDN